MENNTAPNQSYMRPPRWVLLIALLLGNTALAVGLWIVRLTDAGPISAAFWRMFLALPFLVLFAMGTRQQIAKLPRRTLVMVAIGATALGLDLASTHIGVGLTRLGNATLFSNAGSIVLMFWGFIIARVLPKGSEWIAILCALTGAGILLGRSLEISTSTFVGDLFCLAAGLSYAVYLLTLQNARNTIGSWSLLVWVSIFACPVLLCLALVAGEPFWPTAWTPIILLFVTSQLIGQGLMVYSLGHFPPLVIGLALLTQPAVAAVIGYLVFGEILVPLDIIGMLLLGSALVFARGVRPAPRTSET